MAEAVLKTHDLDFCSRPRLRGATRLSYNASDLAFSPYTDYWKEMRKLCVVHLFSRVQKHRPIREDEVGHLVEKIFQLSVDSQPVNLSEAMMCLSRSIICRIGFGKRYDDGAERSRVNEQHNESEAMLSAFSFSDYFPFMGWVDRFTGFLTRLEKAFKELDTFYQQLIDEHLDPNRLIPQEEDLLDVLLRIRMDQRVYCGTNTTAATVIWVMSALMKNPKCLKKTQAEVRDLVGKKGFINEDDVQALTYLKAVVKETFRLHPTAPMLLP
ncbi:hypothetical protein J1N35_036764 [Gossypium stocksii]|uniref:Cytochrome P450 n=1 Tax=Gossypium stocksii TaxID=47602 RepID=A0A9D3ZL88_9ROSI|nr:hypothetical protein J1N35_036764 [Gossypium stocksii]